ncbi:MAG: hypothetical protein GX817_04120 [Elusimicrobia bacterium]|nr:hypothetical protein [Elusimicrobiota bacterium]
MTSKSRFPYRYILILFMGVLCTPAFLSLPRVGILPANFIKTPGFRYLIEGYPASGLLNMVAVMLMEYRIVFLVIAVFSLFAGGVGLVLKYEKKDPTLGSFASNLGQGVLYDFRDLPVLIKLPIFILVGYLIIRGCLLQGGGVVAGFLLAYLLLPPFRSNRLEFIKNAHSIEFLYLLFSAALVFLIFLIFLISGFSESHYPGIFRTWERFAAVRIIFINIVTGVISYSYTLLIIKILLIENEIGLSDD